MNRWNILLAVNDESHRHTTGGAVTTTPALAEQICRAWPGSVAPAVNVCDPEEITTERLHRVDILVLHLVDSPRNATVEAVIEVIEELAVPLLVILDPAAEHRSAFEAAGALAIPAGCDPAVIAASIHGLLHRQTEFRHLRQELTLAHRFHGGLEGEIARMHEELQLAAMVQRELLPREMPRVCGVSVAALWRPANYVSGDIYDVIQLDDDHLGLFIADAVGHGVPAALMTMVINRSLTTRERAGSGWRILSPAEVLGRLNAQMIRRGGHSTRFATAVYGVIDCRRRVLQLAGAGHPPPLHVTTEGAIEPIETNGGLLGIFDDESYDQVEVELTLGDRIIMYSDGFEQAFPAPRASAYEQRLPTGRYRREFERLAAQNTPAAMIEHMRKRLDAQRGSLHQVDDLTMICAMAGALDAAGDSPADSSTFEHDAPVNPFTERRNLHAT